MQSILMFSNHDKIDAISYTKLHTVFAFCVLKMHIQSKLKFALCSLKARVKFNVNVSFCIIDNYLLLGPISFTHVHNKYSLLMRGIKIENPSKLIF